MSPHSKTSKTVLLLIAFSLTVGTVAAQDANVTIEDEDKVIWEQSDDRVLNAKAACEDGDGNENTIESLAIMDSSRGTQILSIGEAKDRDSYDVELNISREEKLNNRPDDYELSLDCSTVSDAESFSVDSMDAELTDIFDGDDWYVGFDNTFGIEFSSENGKISSGEFTEVSVSVEGTDLSKERNQNLGESLNLAPNFDWDKIFEGSENSENITVTVEAFYSDEEGSAFQVADLSRDVKVNRWRISNVDVRPGDEITSSQFNQLSLTGDIYYEGVPVNRLDDDFGPDNFYFEETSSDNDGNQWFSGQLEDESTGTYSLRLGPTPSNLEEEMTVVFDSDLSDSSVEVADIRLRDIEEYVWNTKVLSPDQNAVEADFRIEYEDSYVNFTSTNGDFSEKIRPGKHNVKLEFPTSRLDLEEVSLNERNSGRNIIYDYLYYSDLDEVQSADTLEGIKPVNLAAYNFAYPLEEQGSMLEMRFNNEQIDSADAVKVFECTEWHFGDQECRSVEGWSEVESVTTVPASWRSTKYSTAKFNIDTHNWENEGEILQNAYIVGTSADLILNNEIDVRGTDAGRVETGGDVEVRGRIASENDNFVEGAEVDVSFHEGETEVESFDTVTTGSEGRFSVEGEAPSEPGNYTVRLEASAENYNDLETEFEDSLEVYIAEGIALDMEDRMDVVLGQETSAMIDIDNTGQTEMQDIQISFSGLNSDFYSVSRQSFSSIEAGETVTTEVTFDLPESYGVDDYPELEVEATAENEEGEQFEDDGSILAQLTYGSGEEASEQSETSDEEEESSSFSTDDVANMTGEFLESQSSLNIALGLILVFMMALVGAVKKKKQENADDRRRGDRPKVQRPSLQKPDEPQEDQESSDVDSQIDEIAGAFGEEADDESEKDEETAEDEPEDEELDEVIEAASEQDDEEDTGDTVEEESDEMSAGYACSVCGEEFDSESGRNLHEDVAH